MKHVNLTEAKARAENYDYELNRRRRLQQHTQQPAKENHHEKAADATETRKREAHDDQA